MPVDSPIASSVNLESQVDPQPGSRDALRRRALDLWPRLERRALARCGDDTRRIALYVSHRTSLSVEAIQALIERQPEADETEGQLWFG